MAEARSTAEARSAAEPLTERVISYAEAGTEAVREEMRRDPTIFYIGQGIGPRGGNFQQSKGLWAEFGEERVRDTPIAELAQTAIGVGAALAGSRPIVDIVFFDFLMEASGQIVQQASTIHYISNGKFKVPLVVRAAMGNVRSSGPHHSHTNYSWYMHVPGLKVILPSTPYDVKGLLKTAIRDDDPVIFIEHKSLYGTKGVVPAEEYTIPLGQAAIRRTGNDITIVAVSAMAHRAVEAAELLAAKGISAEVIDPRTVAPLDKATILNSVSKTGRLAIVDEAYANCGFAAEVAAMVCEEILDDLDAPVRRICGLPAPHGFSPSLVRRVLPSAERIVKEVEELLQISS
jgi:pyruvate/2-oxoglutarate/acetoin dehydrogenase E1 component